jgi:hypothetical protein
MDLFTGLGEFPKPFAHFTDDFSRTIQPLTNLPTRVLKLLVHHPELLIYLFIDRSQVFGKQRKILIESIAHLSPQLFYLLLHQGPYLLRRLTCLELVESSPPLSFSQEIEDDPSDND